MTEKAISDYLARRRTSYLAAGRREKGQLLSEMEEVSGLHRKALIRNLNRSVGDEPKPRRGRPPIYGEQAAAAAAVLWLANGRAGSRHLEGAIPGLLELLRTSGELALDEEVQALISRASASTLRRLLKPKLESRREARNRHGFPPSDEIKKTVPVKTFADWKGTLPGYLEADLVAHCGGSLEGFHLWTLAAVDVATGWLELEPLWGRSQYVVTTAVDNIRRRLPVAIRGLDTDNGSEFLNHKLVGYCQERGIKQTRSRPFKKNDACWVEQKNGAVVRRHLGHRRFETRAAFEQIGKLYRLLCLHHNFVRTQEKVVEKRWAEGGKHYRRYDRPQTPYRRLLESGVLDPSVQKQLEETYHGIAPIQLVVEIDHLTANLKASGGPDWYRIR